LSTRAVVGRHLPLSSVELRKAFGRFTTGVVVVTAPLERGGWAAVTVNSFTSVSLAPPLVLWCLGLNANCRGHFENVGRFAVNVLRHDQQALSNALARPSSCDWSDVRLHRSVRGNGLIPGALATFECTERSRFEAGDHLVFVGEVEAFDSSAVASPLAFFQGSYGSFSADQSGLATPPALRHGDDAEVTLGWG
jgi:flavin reductase (DIM6/NTAB) family NADH-FMN oxidoreductase RutF